MSQIKILPCSILITILILLSSPLISQSLDLVKGKKTRSIKPGSHLLVSYSKDHQYEDCDYCIHADATGTLVEVTDSVLVLAVSDFSEVKKGDGFDLITNVRYEEDIKQLEIPLSEIFYVKVSKSAGASNRSETFMIIAAISFLTGLVNILIGFGIVLGDGKGKNVLFVGLIETGLGLLLFPFSYKRSYKMHNNIDDPWRILGI